MSLTGILSMLLAFVIVVAVAATTVYSAHRARSFETAAPPIGEEIELNGATVHFLDRPAEAGPSEAPPLLFLHGAGGNLRDTLFAFGETRLSRHRSIFVDRPGQGYSDPLEQNFDPRRQAEQIAALLDHLQVERAIVVGHSFGGAVALAFAVEHREKTAALALIAPASHPWPGGVAWYNAAGSVPVLGRLMAHTIVVPYGESKLPNAVQRAFLPSEPPANYTAAIGASLALRPTAFRSNAADIASLIDHVSDYAPRYAEIAAPTEIITGDADGSVRWSIHSAALDRDIPASRLTVIPGGGHMIHHTHTDEVVATIERAAREAGARSPGRNAALELNAAAAVGADERNP